MIFFGNRKIILIIIIFCSFFNNDSFSIENKIIIKVDNDIITSLDIENEINYLKTLNKQFQNLDYKTIYIAAKNSLIRETIKKKEISKYVKEIKIDESYLDELVKQTFMRIGIKSKKDFYNYVKANNLELNIINHKLTIEALWNQLIFSKYSDKVKIDETKLKKKISNIKNKKIKIYSLSEILFEVPNNEKYENRFKEIKESINKIGFENTASIFSISDSSKLGGKIGWIDETALSNKVKKKLESIDINQITEPTLTVGGFLILKIDEIKFKDIQINLDKELKNLIRVERNKQFNQYSNIYFNKIKMDIKINEL